MIAACVGSTGARLGRVVEPLSKGALVRGRGGENVVKTLRVDIELNYAHYYLNLKDGRNDRCDDQAGQELSTVKIGPFVSACREGLKLTY